ncbi:MAG TPA: hypothetical protein D7I06_00675, partial [Candidatus Poseidoniales archaeon]
PENLTQVQRSLLNAVKQGVVPHTEVENILTIHDIKVSDLMREYERLGAIMGQDQRAPREIVVPEISLLAHEEAVQTIVEVHDRKIRQLEADITRMNNEIESLNSKLTVETQEKKMLQNRGLFARILNRKK